jgi:hypothetical protein
MVAGSLIGLDLQIKKNCSYKVEKIRYALIGFHDTYIEDIKNVV